MVLHQLPVCVQQIPDVLPVSDLDPFVFHSGQVVSQKIKCALFLVGGVLGSFHRMYGV